MGSCSSTMGAKLPSYFSCLLGCSGVSLPVHGFWSCSRKGNDWNWHSIEDYMLRMVRYLSRSLTTRKTCRNWHTTPISHVFIATSNYLISHEGLHLSGDKDRFIPSGTCPRRHPTKHILNIFYNLMPLFSHSEIKWETKLRNSALFKTTCGELYSWARIGT